VPWRLSKLLLPPVGVQHLQLLHLPLDHLLLEHLLLDRGLVLLLPGGPKNLLVQHLPMQHLLEFQLVYCWRILGQARSRGQENQGHTDQEEPPPPLPGLADQVTLHRSPPRKLRQ
jgi:hypothetical protein